jgi:hypothetical protein
MKKNEAGRGQKARGGQCPAGGWVSLLTVTSVFLHEVLPIPNSMK